MITTSSAGPAATAAVLLGALTLGTASPAAAAPHPPLPALSSAAQVALAALKNGCDEARLTAFKAAAAATPAVGALLRTVPDCQALKAQTNAPVAGSPALHR